MNRFLKLAILAGTFVAQVASANTCKVFIDDDQIPITEKTVQVLNEKGYNVVESISEAYDGSAYLISGAIFARIWGCVAAAYLYAPRGKYFPGPRIASFSSPRFSKNCDKGVNEAIQQMPSCSEARSSHEL